MIAKELKDVLELMDDDAKVGICVNAPVGWLVKIGEYKEIDNLLKEII